MYQILHVTLEYIYGVGGIKTVVNGLVNALQLKNTNNFVITPFYDFFKDRYTSIDIKPIATVNHLYNKILHTSMIFTATNNNIVHYMVQPNPDSSVKKIFDVGEPIHIYQAFNYSEPQARIEYFNSAVAGLINNNISNIPKFDIIHTNAWHTSLSACLIKEFNTATIPKIVSTIHMLSAEQGIITKKNHIINILTSVGLPIEPKFLDLNNNFNQMYLGLQYADQVVMVSQGLMKDAINDKSFGLSAIFNKLMQEQRLHAITNGNNIINWDATLTNNLGKYALTHPITTSKNAIKKHLATEYDKLHNQHNNPWYLYVGRFSEEKGLDMLSHALQAIKIKNGYLIIIGTYASTTINHFIDDLKLDNHVILIDNIAEQASIGKYFRAACEFTLVPSHIEACGLIPMEAMASCSIPITSDVQGLPDTIISLINNTDTGNGFIYNNHEINRYENLKNIINVAYNHYLAWIKQKKLDNLLSRIQQQAYQYDWHRTPSDDYIKLYQHTLKQPHANKPLIKPQQKTITILHAALEYKAATLGGLGTVTSQMLDAQNKFHENDPRQHILHAHIITPYYLIFEHLLVTHIVDIKHLYNQQEVVSSVYFNQEHNHYLIKSSIASLFDINTTTDIYKDQTNSKFIDRIKYFSSAVAAFINYSSIFNNHFVPQLIQMHGWHTVLIAKLLLDYYHNHHIKTIFTVHINNTDRGTYQGKHLQGIGLQFSDQTYILKQIGINYCDYIITVSPNLLAECCQIQTSDCLEIIFLKKAFLKAKLNNKITSILNGINYHKYRYLETININLSLSEPNLAARKQIIKNYLAAALSKSSRCTINPQLPVILYVGRFSAEKGIDAFAKLIPIIKNKAVFYAIGKGTHNDIANILNQNIQDNIFITNDLAEQKLYGELMRACADFMFVPSHIEACGLVPMEGFANGSLCITTGSGGLKNVISPISIATTQHIFAGNSIVYQDYNTDSLLDAINSALRIWNNLSNTQKHQIHSEIIQTGAQFDWLAPTGAMHRYLNTYNNLILFKDKIIPTSNINPNVSLLKRLKKII